MLSRDAAREKWNWASSSYTCGWAVGGPGREPARSMIEHDLLDHAQHSGVKLVLGYDSLPLHRLPAGD